MSSSKSLFVLAGLVAACAAPSPAAAQTSEPAWVGPTALFGADRLQTPEGADLDVARSGHAAAASVTPDSDRIAVATRAPGGAWQQSSFARPRHPTTDRGSQTSNAVDVAVAEDGSAAVLFQREIDGAYNQLWMSERPAGATAWSDPEPLTTDPSQKAMGTLAAGPGGELLLAYDASDAVRLKAARRAAGATSFGPAQALEVETEQGSAQGIASGPPKAAYDSTGRAIVAFACSDTRSCAGGGTYAAVATAGVGEPFAPAEVIARDTLRASVAELETNAAGDALVVVATGGFSTVAGRAVVARDGAPFGEPQVVTPDLDASGPDVSGTIAPDGSALVGWRGYRYDVAAESSGARFLAATAGTWTADETPAFTGQTGYELVLSTDWAGRFVAVFGSGESRWARRTDGVWNASAVLPSARSAGRLMARDQTGNVSLLLRNADGSAGAQSWLLAKPAGAPQPTPDEPAPTDTTDPVVTFERPTAGQRVALGATSTATYRCEDAVAIASCTPLDVGGHTCEVAAKVISCSGPVDTSAPGERQLRVRARDAAGRETLTGVGYVVTTEPAPTPAPTPTAGGTPPEIDLRVPQEGATYYPGIALDALFSCSATAVSCTGTTPSGQRFVGASGTHRFTVVAVDAAGNRAERTITYRVLAPAQNGQKLPAPLQQQAKPAVAALGKVPTSLSSGSLLAGPKIPLSGLAPGSLAAAGAEVLLRGNQVVAAGGANVVAAGGANVVAPGGANVVAAGGGNVIAPGGANVIAPGGANVVAPGGANLRSAFGPRVAKAKQAPKAKLVRLASARRVVPASGKVALQLRLTKAGRAVVRKAFRRTGKQRLTVFVSVGTAVPGSGLPATTILKPVVIRE